MVRWRVCAGAGRATTMTRNFSAVKTAAKFAAAQALVIVWGISFWCFERNLDIESAGTILVVRRRAAERDRHTVFNQHLRALQRLVSRPGRRSSGCFPDFRATQML